ncbi:DUF1947 domain-containing protein [Candidatus Bathyarchaeota archaeon]|nr:DUF1947 domain-containing protein [Candidatus Bathyarchaeota archaeon]
MPKRNRYFLKSKDAKKLTIKISKLLGINIEEIIQSKIHIEVLELDIAQIFILNGRPLIAKSEEHLFPTLFFEELFSIIPHVVVDMGAVPYVCKGANVMAPGVKEIEDFSKNELLLIVDERYGKPLAVGLSLTSSHDMKTVKKGKIVKNLHYVGDKIWDYLKTF